MANATATASVVVVYGLNNDDVNIKCGVTISSFRRLFPPSRADGQKLEASERVVTTTSRG